MAPVYGIFTEKAVFPGESYWDMIVMVVCYLLSFNAAKKWTSAFAMLNQTK